MACDESRSNSDEKYRKSVRQDGSENPANIALEAVRAAGGEILSFLENQGGPVYILWKALCDLR